MPNRWLDDPMGFTPGMTPDDVDLLQHRLPLNQNEPLSGNIVRGDYGLLGLFPKPLREKLEAVQSYLSRPDVQLSLELAQFGNPMAVIGPTKGPMAALREALGGRLGSARTKISGLMGDLGAGPFGKELPKSPTVVEKQPWGAILNDEHRVAMEKAMWGDDLLNEKNIPFNRVETALQKMVRKGSPDFQGISEDEVSAIVPGAFAEAVKDYSPEMVGKTGEPISLVDYAIAKAKYKLMQDRDLRLGALGKDPISLTLDEGKEFPEPGIAPDVDEFGNIRSTEAEAEARAAASEAGSAEAQKIKEGLANLPSFSVAQQAHLQGKGLNPTRILEQLPTHGQSPLGETIPRSKLEVKRALEIAKRNIQQYVADQPMDLETLKTQIDALGPSREFGGRGAIISEKGRKALWMHLGQGMTTRKVAEKLGVDNFTVDRWVANARKHWGR